MAIFGSSRDQEIQPLCGSAKLDSNLFVCMLLLLHRCVAVEAPGRNGPWRGCRKRSKQSQDSRFVLTCHTQVSFDVGQTSVQSVEAALP